MSIVKWNTTYSVEHTVMDNQHQRLFDLINKLHEAMSQGKGKETLPQIFDDLLQYTRTHFTAEEALLHKHNYPDFAAHKRLHEELISKLVQLQKQFNSGDFSVSMQTRDFLQVWLVDHIKGNDLKYGNYLKQKGLS